ATACEFKPPRSATGLRLMNRLPRLTEAFQPEVPMEEPTSATAGSARTTASPLLRRLDMAWDDTSAGASVPPQIQTGPASGEKALRGSDIEHGGDRHGRGHDEKHERAVVEYNGEASRIEAHHRAQDALNRPVEPGGDGARRLAHEMRANHRRQRQRYRGRNSD